MPHVLIKRINGVRAEAESMATNLSASALSTPETGVNNEKHRTPRPKRTSPSHPPNGAPVPYRFARLFPGDTACASRVGRVALERLGGGGR